MSSYSIDLRNMTKDEIERLKELIRSEISYSLKECTICKNKFKDYLDNKTICVTCEREQKLNELGIV